MTSASSFRDWKRQRVNTKYVRKEIIKIKIEIMKYKRGKVQIKVSKPKAVTLRRSVQLINF